MDPVITFEQLELKNAIDLNGGAKDFSGQSFWHYTNKESLYKIFSKTDRVQDYTFRCSKISKVNDLEERQRENADNVFVTCFCNTNSEKIPMWFLYGSLASKGVSIGITPSIMLTFLKSIEFVYAVRDNNYEKLKADSFDVKYGWIYYKKGDGNKVKVNFKGKFYEVKDFDERRSGCYFIKDYVWNYEKEFRIIIIDKQNRKLDYILLPIPEGIVKQIKIKTGKNSDIEEEKLPISKNKIEKSKLKIAINLLKRNKDEILNYIKNLFAQDDLENNC